MEFWGGKVKYLFRCFPIEIKIKYGVSALATRGFMTDLIFFVCVRVCVCAIRGPD